MELTRNLYRLEEVKASFIFCMLHGKTKAALFWAEEILASECGWELGGLLIYCWIWFCCPYDVALVYQIQEAEYDGDIDTRLVQIILRLQKGIEKAETNVLVALTLGLRLHPTGGYTRKGKDVLSDSACRGLGNRMWYYLSTNLSLAGRLPAMVRGSLKEKKMIQKAVTTLLELSEMPEFKLSALAACCVVISCRKDKRKIICKPLFDDWVNGYMLSVESWLKTQGKRTGRIYQVEKTALPGVRMTDTLNELYDIYPALKKATPFWQRITAAYDSSDSSRELFYDTWFPNDIPDEWSLEDQQSSHGSGYKSIDARAFIGMHFRPFKHSKFYGLYLFKINSCEKNFLDLDALYMRRRTVQPLYG